MKHVAQSVHDLHGKKMCDLYDSTSMAQGQAYDIVRTTELNGWKEITFTLPYMVDKKSNFRWKYIRNEYRLRVIEDDAEDWYIICSPKKSRSNGLPSTTVLCYHSSAVLKTKNLYLAFDDTNGIDTCQNLIKKALQNTGWTLGESDKFLERDNKTEKIRSLNSDGKVGAYQQISNICSLFCAYPVFNGKDKTVSVYALKNKKALKELIVGKTLTALSATYNSDDIVTRLYVEGEYGDNGYVGIDNATENKDKLPFILNFDYYRENGLFTAEHELAQARYKESMGSISTDIAATMRYLTNRENEQNTLWGQPGYIVYENVGGYSQAKYYSASVEEDDKTLNVGDKVLVDNEAKFEFIELTSGTVWPTGRTVMVKFLNPTSGMIGARETTIEAKEKIIQSLQEELDNLPADETTGETSDDESTNEETTEANPKKTALEEQIAKLEADIDGLKKGIDATETSEAVEGLYDLYSDALLKVSTIDLQRNNVTSLQEDQSNAEGIFVEVMGDMLRDGYWSDTNYIPGQEDYLYEDALEMSKVLAKPQVSYTIGIAHATDLWGHRLTKYDLNGKIRLYDPELEVNDIVFIKKLVEYLDDNSRGSIEISNDDLSIKGKTFDSILSRITQVADFIEQKAAMYAKADALTHEGNLAVERLNGTIDVLKNRLLSTTSSWYTDDAGNIVFLALNGKSAMMLTGEGFMIANGKTKDGEWNWRTFGTGEGFTADAIIAGYLSADRIEANSIGLEKFSSDLQKSIGWTLDEDSITEKVQTTIKNGNEKTIHISETEPESPTVGMLWLDISQPNPVLYRRTIGLNLDADDENTVVYYWELVNGFYSGSEEPSSPYEGALWWDTSSTPPVLKKYTSGQWIQEININNILTRIQVAESKITDDSIVNTVRQSEEYADDLKSVQQSAVTQTVGQFEVRFTEQDERISNAQNTADGLKQNVDAWFRFSADGLSIGKEGSPFMTKQDNEEYGFYHEGQKIAYMRGSVQNIPQAYARNILRIGGLMGTVDSEGNITWTWVGLDE